MECSRPLLMNSEESSLGSAAVLQSFKQKEEAAHRYVNIQPGMGNNFLAQTSGNIQLEERNAMLPGNKRPDDVSIL